MGPISCIGGRGRRMDLKLPDDIRMMRMDKRALKRAVDELNEQMGFVPTPGMTPELSQRAFLDEGIHPEDNAASCEIKRMRSESAGAYALPYVLLFDEKLQFGA